MERISAAVIFCVVLIVGILLQAPPQVYKNVSSYYESLGKAWTSPPAAATTVQRPASKKIRSRKPAPPKVEVQAASFLGEEIETAAISNDQELPSANDPARP